MTGAPELHLDLENQIVVSLLDFHIRIIKDGKALVKLKMNMCTENDNISEIQYPIPFSIPHKPTFLSVTYKDQEKFADIKPFSNFRKIDDKVAKGNFSIFLDHKNTNTTILVLTNFNKDINNVLITVELEALLPTDDKNLYFEVPLIDNYKQSLNPDYNIFFEILSQEVKITETQLQFNGKDHTYEIKDKSKIEASNVSLRNNLCLKMQLRQIKLQNHISLCKTPNLILFIDDNFFKYPYFRKSIINFIEDCGSGFQFNIIRYGNRSDILSKTMVDKTSESPNQIRLFFEKSLQNSQKSTFSELYTKIFSRDYNPPQLLLDSSQKIVKNKEIEIKDVNFTNSTVICFGSHKGDQIQFTRKVPTFLVDLAQNHNTRSFAIKNGFHYLTPMINSKSGFKTSLDQILQKLGTVEEKGEVNPDQIFKESVANILRKSDKTIPNVQMLAVELKSNGLLKNLTYGRLDIIMNEIEENGLITFDDIPDYLEQISKSDSFDYNFLNDLLNERNNLFHLICRFVVVKFFGNGVHLPFILSSAFNVICDQEMTVEEKFHFLLSYSSNNFVHFETEHENFSEIKYISAPSYSSEVEEDNKEIPFLLHDDDFEEEEEDNSQIEQKPENEKKENVNNNQEVKTTSKNDSQTEENESNDSNAKINNKNDSQTEENESNDSNAKINNKNDSQKKENESNDSNAKINNKNNSQTKENESNDSNAKINNKNNSQTKENESNDSNAKINNKNNSQTKENESNDSNAKINNKNNSQTKENESNDSNAKINNKNNSQTKENESNDSNAKINNKNNSQTKENESNDSNAKINNKNNSQTKENESNDSNAKINNKNNSQTKENESNDSNAKINNKNDSQKKENEKNILENYSKKRKRKRKKSKAKDKNPLDEKLNDNVNHKIIIEKITKDNEELKKLLSLKYELINNIDNLKNCLNGTQNQCSYNLNDGNFFVDINKQYIIISPLINVKPNENEIRISLINDQISSLNRFLDNINNQILLIKNRFESTYSEESKKIIIQYIYDKLDEIKNFYTNAREKTKVKGNSLLESYLEQIHSLHQHAMNNLENMGKTDYNILTLNVILGIVEQINQIRNDYNFVIYFSAGQEQEIDNNQNATNNIINRNNLPDEIEQKNNINAEIIKVLSDTKTKFTT